MGTQKTKHFRNRRYPRRRRGKIEHAQRAWWASQNQGQRLRDMPPNPTVEETDDRDLP